MAARQSFTSIQCASPADAARLANLLVTAPWGGTPPDMIEAAGAEVDLTWRTAAGIAATVPAAAITAAKSGTTIGPVAFTHKTTASGGSTTTSARQ